MDDNIQEQTQVNFSQADIISACEKSFNFFGGIALPDVCVANFPAVYIYIVEQLKAAFSKPRSFIQFAIGLPRGHAKTTLLKLIVVFIILFTKKKFILIVCHTADLAENFIADVCTILDSPNILRTFGNWRTFQSVNRQDLKTFRFRDRDIIIGGLGAGGTVRGLNIGNARPDIILMDDLQSKEEAESPVVAKKLLMWFTGTLLKAKNPLGCTFIYCGNMYRDLKIDGTTGTLYTCLLRNLQLNKNWISIIVGAIKADGTALWEEVQPLDQLLNELENDISLGCAEVFYSEVLNDPKCGSGVHFDLSRFPQFALNETLDLCTGKFLLIDPSLGKKKNDAQIVGYCEVYDRIPHARELFVKQVSAPELVKFCLHTAIIKKIPLIVAETGGYQGTLLQWFVEYADNGFTYKDASTGEEFHYAPNACTGIQFKDVSPEGIQKTSRIIAMFKSLMEGKVRIFPNCLSLVLNQIASYDPLKTNNVDDILDVLAYFEKIINMYANEMVPVSMLESMWAMMEPGSQGVQEDNCVF